MILPAAYFPPVEYFVLLAGCSTVFIEDAENYVKQTWRNRCRILTANGPQDLRFPIVHDGCRLITGIRVDYSTPWVRQTEYAIRTAYDSSPFFEYYCDSLFAILDSHPETLWELDRRITEFFCEKIGLPSPYGGGVREGESYCATLSPKRAPVLVNAPYWQVFADRFGFTPNLSIMDLLFNEGPESICYLKRG